MAHRTKQMSWACLSTVLWGPNVPVPTGEGKVGNKVSKEEVPPPSYNVGKGGSNAEQVSHPHACVVGSVMSRKAQQ